MSLDKDVGCIFLDSLSELLFHQGKACTAFRNCVRILPTPVIAACGLLIIVWHMFMIKSDYFMLWCALCYIVCIGLLLALLFEKTAEQMTLYQDVSGSIQCVRIFFSF